MYKWEIEKLKKEVFLARIKFFEIYKKGDIVDLKTIMKDLNVSFKIALNLIDDLEYNNPIIHKRENKLISVEEYTYDVW